MPSVTWKWDRNYQVTWITWDIDHLTLITWHWSRDIDHVPLATWYWTGGLDDPMLKSSKRDSGDCRDHMAVNIQVNYHMDNFRLLELSASIIIFFDETGKGIKGGCVNMGVLTFKLSICTFGHHMWFSFTSVRRIHQAVPFLM
jgi:hypothetical protein